MNTYRFFRERLSQGGQRAYDALERGMLATQSQIKFGFVMGDINRIFQAVLYDCPMVFHTVGYSGSAGFGGITLSPEYTLSPEQKVRADRAVLLKVQSLANCSRRMGDEWQTALNLHDELCRSTVYDMSEPNAHTAFGVLAHGRGVCDGISKSFKLCCDAVGIECICVSGKARSDPEIAAYESHCWNKVRINGVWYNVDVTFDLTAPTEPVRHDYFLVSDSELAASHSPSSSSVPCNANGNYYGKKGYLYRDPDMLASWLVSHLGRESYTLEIKFAPEVNMSDIVTQIGRAVQKTFNQLGRGGSYTLTYVKSLHTGRLTVK